MLSPEEALDIFTDQILFSRWLDDQGLTYEEGREQLTELSKQALRGDRPFESRTLRLARAAHAGRGGARDDIEKLCDFVARAVGLSPRLRDVFELCIVQGMTRRECAARLGVSVETVRTHLRRLRLRARRHASYDDQ